jgi:acyl-CoA synthetase (AMP-forming)/AMP-acid ligase II
VAVPLNTFHQARELGWTLRHADVAQLLTWPSFLGHDYVERLEAAVPQLAAVDAGAPLLLESAPALRAVNVWGGDRPRWARGGEEELVAAGEAARVGRGFLAEVERDVTPADAMVVVYTSGSTADPKGVVHSHGAVVRHSYNVTESYKTVEGDVMFSSMPFFWIGGLVTALLACYHHGATLVTQSSFEPGAALELIETERATIALGWPQQGKSMAEHPSFPERDVSSIRRTSMPDFVAPEQRPPEPHSDSLGMTEACSSHTNFDPYVALPEARRGTFGRSLEGLTHRIVDPATGAELGPGQAGEIAVRGYAVMQRLHKREREEVFEPDGFYRTGDGGVLDDEGWLYFTGRLGEMIKTAGGTNVTPVEVEAALAACPGVLEAYVTGIPDGEGAQLVAAAVVARAGADVDGDDLRARVKRELSAYKVPRHVWVCEKRELPFTDSGKIRKADLADLLAARFT